MYDEDDGPSPEDLERFGGSSTGYCPKCGKEIWDDLEQCPHCRVWITGGASSRSPVESDLRRRMLAIIVILTVIGLLALIGGLRLF